MRTLLSPRWLAYALVAVLAATAMVFLGRWQWGRYELRHEINARIAASTVVAPQPLESVLPGQGQPVPDDASWRRVTVIGRYDSPNEVLLRGRTVDSQVGYEVLTPLVPSGGGAAVLVDRGWVAPSEAGMTVAPKVPPAPTGEVTVTGRVHLSESGGGAMVQVDGRPEIRRANLPVIAKSLPYPILPAYLLTDEGTPGAQGLEPVPVETEKDWLNFGYAFQWWIFAAGALVVYVWAARKELRGGAAPGAGGPGESGDGGSDGSGDGGSDGDGSGDGGEDGSDDPAPDRVAA